MLLLVHILLIVLIFTRTSLLKLRGLPSYLLMLVLLLKVSGGYAIAKYYLSTYKGGDIQGYLADVVSLHKVFLHNPAGFFKLIFGIDEHSPAMENIISGLKMWNDSGYNSHYNDARTVIRFHALLSIVSGNNEWVHLLWSNVMALAGMLSLLRFFYTTVDGKAEVPAAALSFFFLPNVFIWSSAILKEPLLLFVLGMTLRYFQLWNHRRERRYLLILLLSVGGFLLVKSFWLLSLLPGLVGWFLFPDMKKPFQTVALSYLTALVLVLVLGSIWPAWDVPALLFGQQLNMWRFAVFMNAGSLIHPISFAPTIGSFLSHLPEAFTYALVQPWPWQLAKWYHFPLFLENLVFPLLLILCFRNFKYTRKSPGTEIMLALAAGSVIVVVCGLTTPVIGSLIRFRMPGLLLILLALHGYYAGSRKRNNPAQSPD